MDLLLVGLYSGVPVGIGIGIVATARAKTLRTLLKGVPGMDKLPTVWAFSIVFAILLGLIAAWVYDFLASTSGWGSTAYLALAIGLAVVLSVLAYLPLYRGKRMENALEVSLLNFVVGIGFGLLVPWFAV